MGSEDAVNALSVIPYVCTASRPWFCVSKLNIPLMLYVNMLPLPHRTVHRLWPSRLICYSLGMPIMTWVDEAPLIVLEYNEPGIYPIAIWKIFCSLNVKICCSAVLSQLVDLLIPYVQYKV